MKIFVVSILFIWYSSVFFKIEINDLYDYVSLVNATIHSRGI